MSHGEKFAILEAELKTLELILHLARQTETRSSASTLALCLAVLHKTQNLDYIDLNEYVLHLDDIEEAIVSHDAARIEQAKKLVPRFEAEINKDISRIDSMIRELKEQ